VLIFSCFAQKILLTTRNTLVHQATQPSLHRNSQKTTKLLPNTTRATKHQISSAMMNLINLAIFILAGLGLTTNLASAIGLPPAASSLQPISWNNTIPNQTHWDAEVKALETALLIIAPSSRSCQNATNTTKPQQCSTAGHAAPFILKALTDYNITEPAEIAAVLAVMAKMSEEFKYNIGPDPGMGTRMMQVGFQNLYYVHSLPEFNETLTAIIGPNVTGWYSGSSLKNLNATDDQMNQILDLVLPDAYSWASGFQQLTSPQCQDFRQSIVNDGDVGFNNYLGCQGSGYDDEVLFYWFRANQAFGLNSFASASASASAAPVSLPLSTLAAPSSPSASASASGTFANTQPKGSASPITFVPSGFTTSTTSNAKISLTGTPTSINIYQVPTGTISLSSMAAKSGFNIFTYTSTLCGTTAC
jgi:hypothetical protein